MQKRLAEISLLIWASCCIHGLRHATVDVRHGWLMFATGERKRDYLFGFGWWSGLPPGLGRGLGRRGWDSFHIRGSRIASQKDVHAIAHAIPCMYRHCGTQADWPAFNEL